MTPNTVMNLSTVRTYAHRFFSSTLCYGTFLTDNWVQDLLIQYKPVIINEVAELKERLRIMQLILKAFINVITLLTKQIKEQKTLGVVDDRECEGFIN